LFFIFTFTVGQRSCRTSGTPTERRTLARCKAFVDGNTIEDFEAGKIAPGRRGHRPSAGGLESPPAV